MSNDHKHFTLFNPDSNYDFVGRRRLYYALTGVGILASIIALATLGFNKGIDFKGGTKLILAFDEKAAVQRAELHDVVTKVLQDSTKKQDVGQVEVQDFSMGAGSAAQKNFSVVTEKTSLVTDVSRKALDDKLAAQYPGAEIQWATEGEDRVFIGLKNAAPVEATYDGLKKIFADAGFPKVGASCDEEAKLDVELFRNLQMMTSEGKKADQLTAEEDKMRAAKTEALRSRSDQHYTVVVEEFRSKLEEGVRAKYGKAFIAVVSSTSVSASVAGDMLSQGLVAILYAILGIVLYIILRFDIRYAPGALIATVHDVILVIGAFSVAQVKFSMPVVAAVLTVAGYSITDTIVVFDRIREMQERHKDENIPIDMLINSAVNATMSRTILTSLMTLLTSLSIFLFGGGLIRDFAFAMVIGVIVGTFSSIFVASPIFMWLHERFESGKSATSKSRTGQAQPSAA